MTENQLIDLCQEPKGRRGIFWTSEIYGFGFVLREFGFYPSFLPLNIYFSHGITMHDNPPPHEIDNKAPVMFYFSPRLVDAFKKISKKSCFCVISPNVFYRRSRNIFKDAEASGTLAFFAHTTPVIENTMDVSLYIRQLKGLPEKYHPLTVCLHYHDVNKGFHKLFINEEMNVVTVGHPSHPSFISRFYDIIKSFKFLTSNEIGSYAFYGPEMGIPFFLYGAEPVLFNNSDPNIEAGAYTSFKQTNQYKVVQSIFSTPVDEVTAEQKQLVEDELGVYDSISRMKFALILYGSYLEYLSKKIIKKIFKN